MAPYCQIISRGLGNGLVIGNLGNKVSWRFVELEQTTTNSNAIYTLTGVTTCGVGVCSSDILNSRATQIEIKNCKGNVGRKAVEVVKKM